ncbi:lytic transglycosylase domain-containing protein [Pseudoxanthomonas indica]|uniref:Membrane-bound lytic murein transglycosylase D n=1 Tax=Pseudoxanthomonas indica TaxID=428993 RepID=A0A1T5LT10_9GAMM|nr:lytic transglycosylase domain-containing protein [Pseudoxanthomonas indica]GGD39267.1 lytic transglycosylase [Pseudoxanthomonas indica]SKC79113.1 membrane-bound lytic murein transglycosylase D [Pseudoxanthomonas indica]
MSARRVRGRGRLRAAVLASLLGLALPVLAQQAEPAPTATTGDAGEPAVPPVYNGLDIYKDFREGLAEPDCDADATGGRWKQQFAHAPGQLARSNADVLPLFGYVVEALREADLPTEFALIPFVESGYQPGSRNARGPAGLWQFIGVTARNHGVPMRSGYDGRLSPVDSTQAAVRYLKTLHGMFGGDWRLAVMAYNAGEYRVLQSMRRAGMNAQNARPAELPGLSKVTYAYVEKLHALACIFQQADDRGEWQQKMDRQVPRLAAQAIPAKAGSLAQWARSQGHDEALVKRLNPALAANVPKLDRPVRVLAPLTPDSAPMDDSELLASVDAQTESAIEAATEPTPVAQTSNKKSGKSKRNSRSHTVRSGESAWTIARRYGIKPQALLSLNGLKTNAVLKPGMVLALDDAR